jgi:glycosyltransferase involved in cell wall biosynthesis
MPAPSEAISVSVIVPCRNAAPYVQRVLRSLVSQELNEPAEIILVDNSSSDDSRRIAESVRGRLPLRVITADGRANASYARNVGVRLAAGDKLLFVDADDDVAPGYVAAMASALDSHEFVTSRVDSYSLNDKWLHEAHGPPWQAERVTIFFDFMPATGVNVGLRRSLFDKIGGFPEDFPASQDIVFSWRAQQIGAQIQFVREAVYLYRYRDTLRGLFRQCRNWGTSNVLLYRLFRDAGMPRRPLRAVLDEWGRVVRGLARARTKAELAPFVVRLGFCVGRVIGSTKYRRIYL